jgi:DNA repair photolyase
MMNVSKGNMYDFITHTWNTVKGACPHDCSYCYMKRWGEQKPIRFDKNELKTDLGEGNFIFVGSSCDMFADSIPERWIFETLDKCLGAYNKYLFQSKNPRNMAPFHLPGSSVVCTTIETNRWYPEIMRDSPAPLERASAMSFLNDFPRYVTIEPIIDFDLAPMVELIKRCEPVQVNIGADSGNNHLPEPSADKVLALIDELQKFTTIARKSNIAKILGKGQED